MRCAIGVCEKTITFGFLGILAGVAMIASIILAGAGLVALGGGIALIAAGYAGRIGLMAVGGAVMVANIASEKAAEGAPLISSIVPKPMPAFDGSLYAEY